MSKPRHSRAAVSGRYGRSVLRDGKRCAAPDEEWTSVEDRLLIGDESSVVAEWFQGAVVDLPDEFVDEAIGIGPLAESGMAAPVEETFEAALVEEEPIEAGTSGGTSRGRDRGGANRGRPGSVAKIVVPIDGQALGLASAEPQPLQTDLAAPPEDVPFESPPAEQSAETITDPVAADLEIAAESSTVSTDPVREEARTESGKAGEGGLAEVDEEPIRDRPR